MNDLFVERRTQDQLYCIWYSEQVTAINTDNTNNAILHTGSRGHDFYSITQGYGMVSNVTGSYFHEFIGFENVIIPRLIVAEEELPLAGQPLYPTDSPAVPASIAAAVFAEQPFARVPEEDIFALLVDEQMRLQYVEDQWLDQDDFWSARFDKLLLLDLKLRSPIFS